MNNEYRRYLILMGPISLAAMFLAFAISKEWQFGWSIINAVTIAVYFVLVNNYKRNLLFLSVIIALPLVLFLLSIVCGYFDFVDDSYILMFLYSMVLSPIFITIGGFLQPRKI